MIGEAVRILRETHHESKLIEHISRRSSYVSDQVYNLFYFHLIKKYHFTLKPTLCDLVLKTYFDFQIETYTM